MLERCSLLRSFSKVLLRQPPRWSTTAVQEKKRGVRDDTVALWMIVASDVGLLASAGFADLEFVTSGSTT
jgi:hypothetical protein